MKQFALYIHIILAGSLIFGSCSYSMQQDPSQFVDVEDQIEVSILKNLFELDEYLLSVKTIKSDLCAESSFITDFQETDESILLSINGLEIPTDCSNFNTQISNIESFSFTEKSTVVEITIAENLNNVIYLERFNGHISFIHNNLNGIVFDQKLLKDIKNNYLWGGIYSTSDKDIKLFNEFVESMQSQVAYEALENGNYGHFNIQMEGMSAVDPYNLKSANHSFAIEVNEENAISDSDIPDLILNFKMDHPELDLFFVSGNGMVY